MPRRSSGMSSGANFTLTESKINAMRYSLLVILMLICLFTQLGNVCAQDYGLENNMPTFYAELKQQLTFPLVLAGQKG